MKKLTYKEAYDKIIEAYFKDEINIMRPDFCFCGNLSGNSSDWSQSGYSIEELVRMESALFSVFDGIIYKRYQTVRAKNHDLVTDYFATLSKNQYEGILFSGISKALDELKQIHKERDENVEDFQFTKRELV